MSQKRVQTQTTPPHLWDQPDEPPLHCLQSQYILPQVQPDPLSSSRFQHLQLLVSPSQIPELCKQLASICLEGQWAMMIIITSLGGRYGDPEMPSRHDPPLDFTSVVQRKAYEAIRLAPVATGVAGRISMTSNRLRGSTADLLSGITPVAFVSSEAAHKAMELFSHNCGSGSRAPGQVSTAVDLHATCAGARPPPRPL
ncbi:LYR motif-containing protein 9 isoform X1 [Mobula hypostoma]|uniref:LYR motif-containing protein 9 isoform X1 n=1 Tax=Mobula hypostoma TaxID=723540 RepID=UPI002FC36E9C